MISDAELLRTARGYIAQGWTQHNVARDAQGDPVTVDSPRAKSWCMLGSVMLAMRNTDWGETNDWRKRVHNRLVDAMLTADPSATGCTSLAQYNDEPGRTVDEVLAVFDTAIQQAEAA